MTNKKRLTILWFVSVLFCLGTNISYSASPQLFEPNTENYRASFLIEPSTGTILHADREHDKIVPASLVKMMVSLIVMEYLSEGRVKLEEKVTVSKWASKIGGHQVYLKQGEVFELNELMKAVAIGSANDAAVAVAEFIGGDQQGFVDLMNQHAKKLNMKNTVYHNPHGLPPGKNQEENITTAYDQALLGMELLKFPKYLEWSSTIRDTFRNGTFELMNTNRRLLSKMPEVDGLKTGYYRSAGFSVVATAKKGETRLLAVVIGSKKQSVRTQVASRLLRKGINQYGLVKLLEKGEKLEKSIPVKNGRQEKIGLLIEEDVRLFLKLSDAKKIEQHFSLPDSVSAPVQEGAVIGSIELRKKDQVLKKVNLLSSQSIEVKTFWDKIKEIFRF
ncbi:MAG: D-alanyl-D-alanine carboxypeptidase [SAR324 cluster bacterium]|nr:D-alanyl-D-alanine carboxypeptidase [SAR324 cluster bacterium]